ncbi:hypothetical protein [Trueperella pecoris]|uniref:Bacterial EndoU nuclease domain-containing protein n=1 Tax=Trueperella pecoris TaxID=2733571 RepID=A0A7M1QTW9_9ACTO|nr:hypothetical protein [Trueperella pecoris]QOQ38220.1 hypothetical protein HLG82_01345 [Trueperella pecoris]QOR45293.1 hypothetical protein INS88_08450 [Trueperella pecoris]
MSIKRTLQVLIAALTSLSLLSGVSFASAADDTSRDVRAIHLEKTVDAAREAIGVESVADEIVPEQLDSVLSYGSVEGTSTLTVDGEGAGISPLSVTGSSPLLTIKDAFLQENISVTQDGSTMLSGREADYVLDAYTDGSLRVHTVIESKDANHRVPFELNLNNDELAQIEPDGSVGVYRVFDDGAHLLTSVIEAPWAVDAAGNPVETRFELEGSILYQNIEPTSTSVYPITADPFWVPAIIAGIRVGVHVLIKVGPRVVKYVVAPASRVANALRSFSTLTFRAGSNVVRLDKSGMKHILERHHPQYWNGTSKSAQTFFNPKMSVSDVRNVIHGALRNHSSSIRNLGSRTGTYTGSYSGVSYKLVVSNGRVVQFYPR